MNRNGVKWMLFLKILMVAILSLRGSLAAQVANTSTVLGTVTDTTGAVTPGVTVCEDRI